MTQTIDALTFGRRLRHHRKAAELTLQELGDRIGRPAPFLSMLENGRREPKLSHIGELAEALGIDTSALMAAEPPTRRAALEIELERLQADTRFDHLGLPYVRASTTLSDEILSHLVGLYQALIQTQEEQAGGASSHVAAANAAVGAWLREQDGYLSDVEAVSHGILAKAGHQGDGPLTSRTILDLASHVGFTIEPIADMPTDVRSVTDATNGRIFIAQRTELRTRQARKAVLQTLAGTLLGHGRPVDLEDYLRQRVEAAYLASAVLMPEQAVLARLRASVDQRDLDVQSLKETFYVSYEMAAWRFVNLATNHLDVTTHLVVSDTDGMVVKGYANDGLPFGVDAAGGMEGQRICRRWGAIAAYDSTEKFDVFAQYTDTSAGTFFCATHMEPDRPFGVTVGVPFEAAQWFRHRDTPRRAESSCPDPACCRDATDDQRQRWSGALDFSVRTQHRLLGHLRSELLPDPFDRRVYDLADDHT